MCNMSRVERNAGKQAGDQTTNYLVLANYLLQEDFKQWQQL